MKFIEATDKPTSVEALVELARREAGLTVMQGGRAVAEIVPVPQPGRARSSPLHPGALKPSDDFDAPLDDAFWLGK